MNYPLPVVAEKGKLQKMLGLESIERTDTHSFPNGKVVLRTYRLPSKDDPKGSIGVYYTNDENYRAMFELRPLFDWSSGQRTASKETYYIFKSGCVKESEFDALIQTIKMIKQKFEEARNPRLDEES